jgi:DNA polymerase-2
MPEAARLFYVLVPTWRVIRGVPVVHLYGVSDRRESVLCVDDRPRPYFFVPADSLAAAERAARPLRAEPAPDLLDPAGRPVGRLVFRLPSDVPPARERLAAAGIAALEADVRFAYRYMIDAGIRATVEVRGPAEKGRFTDLVFRRPAFAPATFTPELRLLSLDVETDRRAGRIFSVALLGEGIDTVLLVSPRPVAGAEVFPDEAALLTALGERVRAADPDVLTGWNVVDFDLTVLARRAAELSVVLRLGRGDESVRIEEDPGGRRRKRAALPGRQVLDGIDAVRDTGLAVEDFRLETVAAAVLGTTKLATGSGRVERIERAFAEDPGWLVRYNREDARLVLAVLGKTKALHLALERSLLTGMVLDRVGASVATFDFLYLGELRRRGRVALCGGEREEPGIVIGGTVLDAMPGLFPWVAVLDFKSLYPSIIRTFGIDPHGFAGVGEAREGLLRAPNGALFRRGEGILPLVLDRLTERRERAKREKDPAVSTAVKLLMNSFYGVLGTTACRFADPAIANAITSFGGEILRRAKAEIEAAGFPVLYGDTDSLFLRTGAQDAGTARGTADTARERVDGALAAWAREAYGVESRLVLEVEWVFRRLFLPTLRGTTEGSKKRYAGLVDGAAGPELVVVGLEAVRRDWPEAGRRFQRDLLRLVLSGEDPEPFVRDFTRRLRQGEMDSGLVYRKVLRKAPEEYGGSLPPHVRAALLAGRTQGGAVRYVMTRQGPVPVPPDGPVPAGIDHAHYIERVIAPLADAILPFINRRFSDLAPTTQLRLFDGDVVNL